jgi:hypothetical protein
MSGTFAKTITFAPLAALVEAGQTNNGDIFLVKLDSLGRGLWGKSFGDFDAQTGGPIAVDANGGPVITGGFTSSLDFGGGALQGQLAPNVSMYLAKFDSSGAYEWAYAGGPPASSATNSGGASIAADGVSVVTTGTFAGGLLSLAGHPLTPASQGDTYLASFAR